jgi:hypothetical protein
LDGALLSITGRDEEVWMPSAVPPLPGLTRYTTWGEVPAELYTKTQLGQLDPPRKPGSEPVAQVLYHGNSYAPLYELAAAVEKRPCSPAQRQALDRARDLQYLCRRCGARERDPLGRGRLCDRCGPVVELWRGHDQAQQAARALVADAAAVAVVLATEDPVPFTSQHGHLETPGPAMTSIAVVGVADRQVLLAEPVDGSGTPRTLDLLDRLGILLEGRAKVVESDRGPASRYLSHLVAPLRQLPGYNAQETYPFLWGGTYAERLWRDWHAYVRPPDWTTWTTPETPPGPLPWPRTDDAAGDALGLVDLVHAIADGTAPVYENAAWTGDGHGLPDTAVAR